MQCGVWCGYKSGMHHTDEPGLRVLLIDVSAVYWASWHSTANPDGREAFSRTVRRCRELASGWDRVAICVDAGHSGRDELLPSYKANREPHPAPAIEQRDRAIEHLAEDGFHIFRGEGFEADDTIATLCDWAQSGNEISEVRIAAADKDLLQLVAGKVHVLSLTTGTVMDAEAVEAKMGVKPELIPDLLGLVGDKADNIPGCPGIGDKIAADLILQFGDLDAVAAAAVEGKAGSGKRGEALFSNREAYLLSRDLVRLRTDSPVSPALLLKAKKRTNTPMPPAPEDDPVPPADPVPDAEAVDIPKAPDSPFAIDTTATEKGAALVKRSFSSELEPRNMDQAQWLAHRAIQSNVFRGYGSQETALLCILAGREFGLSAVASLRGFHVIEGKLALSAQLVAGIIIKSGLAEYFEPVLELCTAESATWVTHRKGSRHEQRLTYTIEEARQAGLVKDGSNWKKRPATMLRWRGCTELARVIYPDIVGNVYSESETQEMAVRS